MPASKNNNYTMENVHFSFFGRSFSHPVRSTILSLLESSDDLTNKDLCSILELDKSTIHSHLWKMSEGGLINYMYHNKTFVLSKTEKLQLLLEMKAAFDRLER